MATAKPRITITLGTDQAEKLEEACTKLGVSKAAVIQELINQHIDADGNLIKSASDVMLARAEKEIKYLLSQIELCKIALQKKDEHIAAQDQEIRVNDGIASILHEMDLRLKEINIRLPQPKPPLLARIFPRGFSPRSHTESNSSSE